MIKLLMIFLTILLLPIPSFSGFPIEEGAMIDLINEGSGMSPEELAVIVLNQGHTCTSISKIRNNTLSDGYTLACNNGSKDYVIKKIGGSWMVIAR